MRVQIEHADFRNILDQYDSPDTFFYLDPPYVAETRKGGGYAHELTGTDHAELVELLLGLKGKAMLSGYAHELYAPLEAVGWHRKDVPTLCSAAGRVRGSGLQGVGQVKEKQKRTETIWRSPNCEAGQKGLL